MKHYYYLHLFINKFIFFLFQTSNLDFHLISCRLMIKMQARQNYQAQPSNQQMRILFEKCLGVLFIHVCRLHLGKQKDYRRWRNSHFWKARCSCTLTISWSLEIRRVQLSGEMSPIVPEGRPTAKHTHKNHKDREMNTYGEAVSHRTMSNHMDWFCSVGECFSLSSVHKRNDMPASMNQCLWYILTGMLSVRDGTLVASRAVIHTHTHTQMFGLFAVHERKGRNVE